MKKASFLTQPLFLLGISLFIYIMALSLPALTFEIVEHKTIHTGSIYIMKGVEVTIGGILGLLFLQAPAIGWLANPLDISKIVSFCDKRTLEKFFDT